MGGRAVEGARLESAYTSKAYRGFESHLIRQFQSDPLSPPARSPPLDGRIPGVFGVDLLTGSARKSPKISL